MLIMLKIAFKSYCRCEIAHPISIPHKTHVLDQLIDC